MKNTKIINRKDFGTVSVVENSDYQFAVMDVDGNEIVPFGKYAWIDGFDSGLARVRTQGERYNDRNIIALIDDNGNCLRGDEISKYYDDLKKTNPGSFSHWGIINMSGEEVLETVYDNVWNFYGKNRHSTRVEKDGAHWDVDFDQLPGSSYFSGDESCDDYDCYCEPYGEHYGDFAGTYAQEYMGYSDDVIYDAFEGDPDACWNVD